MTWHDNWAQDEPRNKTNDQDCAILKAAIGSDSKFVALQCSTSAHAICQFDRRVRFQLRGICATGDLDSQYKIINSTHLIGDSVTSLRYDSAYEEWQLVNRKSGNVMATIEMHEIDPDDFAPETLDQKFLFPLGTKQWVFKSEDDLHPDCADCPSGNGKWKMDCKAYRTMNLHLSVDQPGYFCCGDGACIHSEYR